MSLVLLLSLLAALATILGGIIPLKMKIKKDELLYLIALAAGVLITVSLIDIIPEAIGLSTTAGLGVLLGFLLMHFIEQFSIVHPAVEYSERHRLHRISLMAFIGLLFHSFIDGIAIVSGFEVSISFGLLVTVAVLVHEFPEGLTTSSLLLATKYSKAKIFYLTFLVAIATPIGAIISSYFFNPISDLVLSIVLGVSAGTFIYIGSTDLLPYIHKSRNIKTFFAFLIGVALILLSSIFR